MNLPVTKGEHPTPADPVRYEAAIASAWRELPPVSDARALRGEILQTLDRLARYATRSLDLSRANLRHLSRLVSLVRPEDIVANGGLLGASNTWYAERLGVQPDTMTTIFRALRRAGLIIPHNPTNNHRRTARRGHDASWAGRGYTLKPLLVRLPALSAEARRLEQDAVIVRAKMFEVGALVRQMHAQLAAVPNDILEHRLVETAAAIRDAGPFPAYQEASDLLTRAFSLSIEVERHLDNRSTDTLCPDLSPGQSGKNSGPHITAEQQDTVLVSALQEGGSGEVRAPSGRNAGDGEMSCGVTIAEARHLFPAATLFIPSSGDHESLVVASSRLADALRINPRLLARSFVVMGIARTMWSLFLVCERTARGDIRATPAAYFNGMVARAATGALDLDRSIWGIRKAIAGTQAGH